MQKKREAEWFGNLNESAYDKSGKEIGLAELAVWHTLVAEYTLVLLHNSSVTIVSYPI